MNNRLTLQHLSTWRAFGGDRDGWVRQGRPGPAGMGDEHWTLLDELVMGLTQVQRGLTTPAWARQVQQRLQESAADEATREALLALAREAA